MILKPTPIVSSALFTRATGESPPLFVAEMSDLPGRGALGRVYDDACDEGLTIVSARTGAEVVCAVDREERDREGDLLWLDLVPVTPGARGSFRVRLFND